MMPLVKSRRKSKIFWPKAKIIIVVTTIIGLLVVAVGVFIKLRVVSDGQRQVVLPAATDLLVSDQNIAIVASFLANHSLTPQDLKINGELVEFKLNKTAIILPVGNDLSAKLEILAKVWRQYEAQGKALSRIDLRYNYPLVSY